MSLHQVHNASQPSVTQNHHVYTLEPLRDQGPDALIPPQTDQIRQIILREIEVHWPNANHDVTIARSDNLFDPADPGGPARQPIPAAGTLARATFDLLFPNDNGQVLV